jgi:predicted nicotinamide N-methyase
VPLVPEIQLYLAAEPIEVWQHTEDALGRTGLPPPYWAFAWPGGQALARYLLDNPGAVAGKRVIDLASGSGLVAIAAALAGAAAVAAYDVDPLAVAAIAVNAAANGVSVTGVCADILDPGGPRSACPAPALCLSRPRALLVPPPRSAPAPARRPPPLGARPRSAPADLVLVADAFYERELAASVMSFLDGARDADAGVLAADLGRAYLPRARLTALTAYDVPGLAAIEDHDVRTTTIWTLRQ